MMSRSHGQKLLAFAAGTILTLLLLEAGLWVLGEAYWQEGGHREVEHTALVDQLAVECPGCRVVLCLGDSYTYGMGASEGMDYPSQLERLLNDGADPPHTIVINAGRGSANSTMVREILEKYLQHIRPDMVTVMVGGANYWDYYGLGSFRGDTSRRRRVLSLLQTSRVVRLVSHALHSMEGAFTSELGPEVMADSYPLTMRWMSRQGLDLDELEHSAPDLHLGLTMLDLGLPSRAVQALERAVEQSPDEVVAHWALAVALRRCKREREAWETYLQAIEVDPEHPAAYFGLGEMCYDLTIFGEERHRWFRQAIAIAPDYGPPYCRLGDSLLGPSMDVIPGAPAPVIADADADAAAAMLWKGFELEPNDLNCVLGLGMYYGSRGGAETMARDMRRHDVDGLLADEFIAGAVRSAGTDEREAWVRHDLELMATQLDELGVPLVMLQYMSEVPQNRVLADVAAERGSPLVSTWPEAREYMGPDQGRADLYLPDNHWTDLGNGIVAELLAKELRVLLGLPGLQITDTGTQP